MKILEENKVIKANVEATKRSKQNNSQKGKRSMSEKNIGKKKKERKEKENESPSSVPHLGDTTSDLCLGTHKQNWIQCGDYRIWGHEACVDVSELSDKYICDYCLIY